MIRAVADTHAILWYLYNDPRLSATAGAIMDSAVQTGDEIAISSITDLQTPIGEILKAVETSGLLIQSDSGGQYAILPLDGELIDFLLERNPKFIDECEQIRRQMIDSEFYTQDETERLLAELGKES